jgi:sulfate adenylyltransferase subunit 1 (EFTu-like GTPase family)
MNGIGVATIETRRPLTFDSYSKNRATGSFILIDPATNATVAAGMMNGPTSVGEARSRVPGSQVTWRFENGSLLVSGIEGIGENAGSSFIEDPEALDALERLLDRLRA